MRAAITILSVEQEEDYGITLTFSDGTVARYAVEELLELRPHRDPIIAEVEKPS
jgi:hypothetical protein